MGHVHCDHMWLPFPTQCSKKEGKEGPEHSCLRRLPRIAHLILLTPHWHKDIATWPLTYKEGWEIQFVHNWVVMYQAKAAGGERGR